MNCTAYPVLYAYWILLVTGCRPLRIVDNEGKKPHDGSWEEVYSQSHPSLRPRQVDATPASNNDIEALCQTSGRQTSFLACSAQSQR